MDNVHPNAIKHIEKALGITLYENQKKYLLGQGGLVGGRATGKTLAYCISLAVSDGEPLDLTKPEEIADELRLSPPDHRRYAMGFFRHEFMKVRDQLKEYGFRVREVRRN